MVGRGGLLRPVEGGTYEVNEAMLADARGNRQGQHASNLGCALARALADEAGRVRRGNLSGHLVGGSRFHRRVWRFGPVFGPSGKFPGSASAMP